MAALLAIVAPVACWFGTRAVVNGFVNFECRELSRQWATAFAHTLSSPNGNKGDILHPYIGAVRPYDGELEVSVTGTAGPRNR
jgi:hypothetical protein